MLTKRLKIVDIEALADIAHGRGALAVVDGTFATPALQRPIALGADKLIYQDLDDLVRACLHHDSQIEEFDTSCFSGEYVTGLDDQYLEQIQMLRSDDAKAARRIM